MDIPHDYIAGTAEVAAHLGCPKQQIHALRRNQKFPQPFKTLAATPLWDIRDVENFKTTWVRRPRKASDVA